MRKTPRELRVFLFQRLTALLESEESCWEIPAMAFLVELLACSDLRGDEDAFLDLFLRTSLRSRCCVMHGLVLRGLVLLCERQEMVRELQYLLPLLMRYLQDVDRDMSTKALLVLSHVVPVMEGERITHAAPLLAGKLLPLFDDESDCVRKLSIQLFGDVMETVAGTKTQQLKMQVHRSLLPLFFHLHDESPSVAEVSQEALVGAAEFLKWQQLRHLAETAQTWRIGKCLLARGRRRVDEYLRQSLLYLESPQESLREAAVRFTALQGLQEDISPSIHSLATQTIVMLRAPGRQSASGGTDEGLCYRLRRAWQRWHCPLRGSCWCSAAS